MRRASSRLHEIEQRELAKIAIDQQKRKEDVVRIYDQLLSGLRSYSLKAEDFPDNSVPIGFVEEVDNQRVVHFDIPFDFKRRKSAEKSDDVSTADEDDDNLLTYRRLKQNLYRHPLCRPVSCVYGEASCNCVDECDQYCQNRLLFM